MYGLKQVARLWHKALYGALVECGCVQSQVDKSLYILRESDSVLFMIVHVNDILAAGNDLVLIDQVMNRVRSRFDLKHLGYARNYLINLSRYIGEIIRAAGQKDARFNEHRFQ